MNPTNLFKKNYFSVDVKALINFSYLIKENQVDIRMSEYKIMKEYKQNNFYNNKIIVIRAQITNIFRYNLCLTKYKA